jgi:hypothetical protein
MGASLWLTTECGHLRWMLRMIDRLRTHINGQLVRMLPGASRLSPSRRQEPLALAGTDAPLTLARILFFIAVVFILWAVIKM